MENQLAKKLNSGIAQLGLQLSSIAQQQLLDYLSELSKWNKTYNLTAITDKEAMLKLHLLDSLSILPYLVNTKTIADVGSGAGMPGIALAIALPECQVTLIESVQKKTRFLHHVIHKLGLTNITVVATRVEDYQPINCFETVLSRAFASINNMVSLTRHLLCPGGSFMVMKGKLPSEELASLNEAFTIEHHPLDVPGVEAERHIIILKGR